MTKPVISVCICTFRRPSVRETISSIVALHVADEVSFVIVSSDNDIEPSGRAYVESMQHEHPDVDITYIHAPSRNISIARNACLDNASGTWIAFIDDDEVATETWLQTHFDNAMAQSFDVSIGPVLALYPDHAPQWIKEADFHTLNVSHHRPVMTGHTSNSFFKRTHPAIKPLRFNEERGRTGGEDTQFFYECFLAGAVLGETPNAIAHEPVHENRLSLDWLVKNKFRSGITYGKVIYYKGSVLRRFAQACMASVKAAFLFVMSGVTIGSKTTSRQHYVRAIFHSGVAGAFFSAQEAEYYGALTPVEPSPSSA